MADFGYDISDYGNIDPIFGTVAGIDELLPQIKRRGMKLIPDYAPNHISNQHPGSRSRDRAAPVRARLVFEVRRGA
jgi:glycosidase